MADLESVAREHEISGARNNFHGFHYQIVAIIQYIKLWLNKSIKDFRVATEVNGVGVFDDIVIVDDSQVIFGQFKHKRTESSLDIWSERELSLPRLFVSYLEVKENPEFKTFLGKKAFRFFVYTNRSLKNSGVESPAGDLNTGFGKWMKLNKELSEELLETTLRWVAKGLMGYLLWRKAKSQIYSVFKYFLALLTQEKILDVGTGKLHKDFISDTGLSTKAKEFREVFSSEIQNKEVSWEVIAKMERGITSSGAKIWPGYEDAKDFLENLFLGMEQPEEEKLSSVVLIDLTWDSFYRRITDWFTEKKGTYRFRKDFEDIRTEIEIQVKKSGLGAIFLSWLDDLGITFLDEWPSLDDFLHDSSETILTVKTPHVFLTCSRVMSQVRRLGLSFYLGILKSPFEVGSLQNYEVLILQVPRGEKVIITKVEKGKIVLVVEEDIEVGQVLKDEPLKAFDERTVNKVLGKKMRIHGWETTVGEQVSTLEDLGEEQTIRVLQGTDMNFGGSFETHESYIERHFTEITEQNANKTLPRRYKIMTAEDIARSVPCVISDFAGTGKTSSLMEICASRQRIRQNEVFSIQILNDKTEILRALKRDTGKPLDLYIKHFLVGDLTKRFFRVALERERVFFVFEGLDQLDEECKETALSLIRNLGENVVLTTRPQLRDEACEKLSAKSYSLVPFTTQERDNFMKMYVGKSIDFRQLGDRLRNLPIPETPGLLSVLAYSLNNGQLLEGELNSYNIMKRFVDDHFIHSIQRNDPQGLTKRNKYFLKQARERHGELALDSSFRIPQRLQDNDLDSELPSFGLLDCNLMFIHRYYADFFMAEVFLKRMNCVDEENLTFFESVLLGPEYSNVRCFVDGALAEEEARVFCPDTVAVTREGWNVLHVAAKERLPNLVKSLADPNLLEGRDLDARTPLLLAAHLYVDHSFAFQPLIHFLSLRLGLIDLMRKNYEKTIRTLLDLGADPNAVNKFGRKAIASIVLMGPTELYNLFLEKGARVETHDTVLLQRAVLSGHLEIVKDLVEVRGMDVSGSPRLTPKHDLTPLHLAALSGNQKLVEYLVEECRVDVYGRDVFGRTALHLGADGGDRQTFDYLLQQGYDPYDGGKFNISLLQAACEGGNLDIVKYLVEELEFDIHAKNDSGLSVLGYCLTPDITEYIVQKMGYENIASFKEKGKIDITLEDMIRHLIYLFMEKYDTDIRESLAKEILVQAIVE